MNTSMPSATPRRLRTVRAITALALAAALGGCATYDYVGSDSPGGYYRGQSRSTYPGYYGGYPDGYYDGYYGYPGGYAPGYYYGGVYYYGGHRYYRPPPHRPPPHPNGDHDDGRPDGGHDRPPPSGNPGGGNRMPSPWRDLDRIGERQQQRRGNDGPPSRPYGVPQGQPASPPSMMRPPQPSGATPARSQSSRPAILPGFHRPKERRQEQ